MCVLRVVHGVFARLAARQVDIEFHLRISRPQEKEVSQRIRANVIEHFAQGDPHPGAPRHPDRLLAAFYGDKLDQQHRQSRRIDPQHGQRLLDPPHLPLVISAPNIDDPVEAPLLELVTVVQNVGPEVGWVAIALDQHFILVRVRLEPGSAVLFEDATELAEFLHRVRIPSLVEAALQKELVVTDREPVEIADDSFLDPLDSEFRERFGVRRESLSRCLPGDFVHVITPVAVLGHRLVLHSCRKGFSEEADLPSFVVDVVLPLHFEAGSLEDARKDVTDDRAARMAEQHRPGRVGADELHLHPDVTAELASPPLRSGLHDRRQLGLQPGRLKRDVDESGRGHGRPSERRRQDQGGHQLVGNRHWRSLQGSSQLQRQRHRVIAVCRVLGSLDDDRGQLQPGRPSAQPGDGVPDGLVDDGRRRAGRRRDQGCVPSVTCSVWFLPPR